MTQRILAGTGEDYMKLQLHLDKLQMVEWVDSLAPWEVISHLTFRWEVSLDAARRGYERFMRRALPHLSYFYAEEANPSRDGYHIHALWADAKTLYRKEAWATWFKRFGRARIEPVRDRGDVTNYCAKYVTKERSWWNVKLQWHRSQALRGEAFTLEREAGSSGYAPLPVPQNEFPYAAEVFNLTCHAPPAEAPQAEANVNDPHQQCLWTQRPGGIWENCS